MKTPHPIFGASLLEIEKYLEAKDSEDFAEPQEMIDESAMATYHKFMCENQDLIPEGDKWHWTEHLMTMREKMSELLAYRAGADNMQVNKAGYWSGQIMKETMIFEKRLPAEFVAELRAAIKILNDKGYPDDPRTIHIPNPNKYL